MANRTYASRQRTVRATGEASVIIEQPKKMIVGLEITGTADLIQNCFNQKTVEQMLRKHMGLSVQREVKKPRDCVENATIRNTRGDVCIPPSAFKKAMLVAGQGNKTVKKGQILYGIWVEGQSIPITFDETVPRMDMVRTNGQTKAPDVRFRPAFIGWKARLVIEFKDQLRVQTVVELLNGAGTVGVGEWRPEKTGTYGTFVVSRHIDSPKEISEIRKACAAPVRPLTIPEWAMDADIDPELLRRIVRSEAEGEAAKAE